MKNILVTGGAGFIGSHLVDRLCKKKSNFVFVIDNFSTGSKRNFIQRDNNKLFNGNLLDAKSLNNIFDEYKFDEVYHLAASVGYFKVLKNMYSCLYENIQTTYNIIQQCIKHDSKLLFTSSSEVYGLSDPLNKDKIKEDYDCILPNVDNYQYGYAISKLAGESLITSAIFKYKLRAIIARLFNTVGERQSNKYGMVLPRFIEQAKRSENLTVFGDGQQQRSFCYVLETVQALEKMMLSPIINGDSFNVGNDKPYSIYELAEKVKEIMQSDSEIELIELEDAYVNKSDDIGYRCPNIQKIKKELKWSPKVGIDDVIRRTIIS